MKYYLDEDLSPTVAAILRKMDVDAVSAHEVGAQGLSDFEQLSRAAAEGRCLVTRNRNDFIELTRQFMNDGRPHCGVLIVPYSFPADDFKYLARSLSRYGHARKADLDPYTIDFLKRAT